MQRALITTLVAFALVFVACEDKKPADPPPATPPETGATPAADAAAAAPDKADAGAAKAPDATAAAPAATPDAGTVTVQKNLAAYFAAFDGSKDWAKAETIYNDLFHPEGKLVTKDGEKTIEEWRAVAKGLVEGGAKASAYEDRAGETPDTFYYKVTLTLADGKVLSPASKATVKDGKLARVEPVDPATYSKIAAAGGGEAAPAAAAGAKATSKLEAKSDSKLAGDATLEATEKGVKVTLTVSGVEPGEHGAHVHEKGDCSAPDGKSAGGHFNPGGHDHALPKGAPRHLGDLGNIVVGADGTGTHTIEIEGANLKEGDANSFLGKAIIVHAKKDDGGQPTGNAGGRIGCGVIK